MDLLEEKYFDLVAPASRIWKDVFMRVSGNRKTFQTRIHGLMVYLNLGGQCSTICRKLRERGYIITDNSPWIRLAPCFMMPVGVTNKLIEDILSVSKDCGLDVS